MERWSRSFRSLLVAVGVASVFALNCSRSSVVEPIAPPASHGVVIAGTVTLQNDSHQAGVVVTLERVEGGLAASVRNAIALSHVDAGAVSRADLGSRSSAMTLGAPVASRTGKGAGLIDGGASPRASSSTTAAPASDTRATVTDARGRFAFASVADGDYLVKAETNDYLAHELPLHVVRSQAETTYVAMVPTATGTFAGDATREATSDATGTIVFVGGLSNVAVTNAAGRYVLYGVPVGTHTISAQYPGFQRRSVTGSLAAAGDSVELADMLLPLERNIVPTGSASASVQCVNNPVSLNGSATDPDGVIVAYMWDFTDDGITDYTSPTTGFTTHVYTVGSYRARFSALDDDGGLFVRVINFDVNTCAAPVVNATATVKCSGAPVNMTGTASTASGTTITQYTWDFENDGTVDYTSATTGITTHLYATGSYTARFTARNSVNETGSKTVTVTVPDCRPPVASASANPICNTMPVSLVGTGSSPDGTITVYRWDFENDGTFDFTASGSGNTSHSYTAGPHTARFQVQDNYGATATATTTFSVPACDQPSVSATAVATCVQEPVTLIGTASTPQGGISQYRWDFENDGVIDYISGASGTVTHSYPAGTWTARFTALNTFNNTATTTVTFTVANVTDPDTLYVASWGTGTGPGTKTRPYREIRQAMERATSGQSCPVDAIILANQAFNEPLELHSGISVLGGYNSGTWVREPGTWTLVSVGTVPATASGITATTLVSDLIVQTTSPSTPGQNSIAVRVENCNQNLTFQRCYFAASNATAGRAGATGSTGQPGEAGAPGQSGSDGSDVNGDGGSGGAGVDAGNPGGRGGYGTAPGDSGGAGCRRGGGGGLASTGCGIPAALGKNGPDGCYGSVSPNGTATTTPGTIVSGDFVASAGGAGTPGTGGKGGMGGGGGGGGITGGGCLSDRGGGGGGGGGGAGGGGGGAGGLGGGSSIAVFLIGSTPTFTSCEFFTGRGGNGGDGGTGGKGGFQGVGGAGGPGAGDSGPGGVGGKGGGGGAGGGGAGGNGGSSVGVVGNLASSFSGTGNLFYINPAGGGGNGALNGDAWIDRADPGSFGARANTLFVPTSSFRSGGGSAIRMTPAAPGVARTPRAAAYLERIGQMSNARK